MVRSRGVTYYVRDLVPGRAEGTGVAGESQGVWTGRGSTVLGVNGTVDPGVFSTVFAGRDPVADRPLRTGRGPRDVAGVDLVFGAPKSVSLLHLLGPGELAEEAGAAHEAAVADAVGYLERLALGVRRTRGGVTRHLPATGVVATAFVHRTSRALDPHVHTHLMTANVAQGVDGTWSAVDTRRLFLHRRPLEAVYGASLRRQLSDRLGVAWERGRSGRWDVVGVDPVLERMFSQRTASIDEHAFRASGGRGSPGQRRVAFHAERPAKGAGPTVEDLRNAWRRRVYDHHLDPADLVRVVGRARTAPARPPVDRDELSARLEAHAGRRPVLGPRELLAAVADSSPAGLDVDELGAVVDALGRSADPTVGEASPMWHQWSSGRFTPGWVTADLVRSLSTSDGSLATALEDPVPPGGRMLPGSDRGRTADRPVERTADRPVERTADRPIERTPERGPGSGSTGLWRSR